MKQYFLQTFNPLKWFKAGYTQDEFNDELNTFNSGEELILSWSIQSHKQAQIGDISFFMVQGVEPRGIYGVGEFVSKPYPDKNWNGNGRCMYYVNVLCKKFTDYTKPFIRIEELKRLIPNYNWSPRSGGMPMGIDVAKALMCRLKWNLL